ncbi:alpha/beta hydrolase [Paraburkholderia phymatum]|uniref:alpha/beta fold hydrolase n=1 Tax=Paraburkholderia phymatum TaxID=148447 RepID=UPI00317C4676
MQTSASPSVDEQMAPEWFSWALSQPGESRRVGTDGVQLHYRGWSLRDTYKPVLLLVHGYGAHARWWDFIAPFLAPTHRVIALDLSGMGDSDHRTHYPPGTGARDITGLIEALEIGPVIAVGHSSGGLRVLRACSERPDLFSRLIVVDSYVVFEGCDHPQAPPNMRGDRIYADFDVAVGRYRLLPEQPKTNPWAFEYIARHSLRKVEGGWRWKFDPAIPAGAQHEDNGELLLRSVNRPVHYVYGEASAIVSSALARRIVDLLPLGYGPVGIPGGYHHLMIDQPAALIATLRSLLVLTQLQREAS